MQLIYLTGYIAHYKKIYDYAQLVKHPQWETIQYRVQVMEFFLKHGAEATRDAFGVSRATVYRWMKMVKDAKGRLEVLAPKSRAPRRRRTKQWHPEILAFIVRYRTEHPGVGQVTVKYALERFCQEKGLPTVSESTIARMIRWLKEQKRIPKRKEVRLNARTGKLHEKKKKRKKKLRSKGFVPKQPGDLVQIDALHYYVENVRRYIISAVDMVSRMAFCYAYERLTSRHAQDFVEKLQQAFPFPIRHIQTDNGSEFEGNLSKFLESQHITHFYNYPHYPKGNALVERFHRTLREQFLESQEVYVDDLSLMNQQLMDYLFWYNTQRPHLSLHKTPPLLAFVQKNCATADSLSQMYWHSTRCLQKLKLNI